MSNRVIVVGGPTASGKTSLGIELALQNNGEIVSADSMQIYRDMDIGTAKASAAERSAVPHHMIDIINPDTDYSVSEYVEAASACCDDILSRGKIPVIVGGTGLYIESLLCGRDFGEFPADFSLRSSLESKYDSIGGEAMLKELADFDPDRAEKLFPNDKRRIIRAFEVYLLSGITITAHDELSRSIPPRYTAEFHILGLDNREELYNRINLRVDTMIADGLVDEVRSLISCYSPSCTALQAIGYKEIISFFNGEYSLESAIEIIKMSSRRYAKRQITWFKRYVADN